MAGIPDYPWIGLDETSNHVRDRGAPDATPGDYQPWLIAGGWKRQRQAVDEIVAWAGGRKAKVVLFEHRPHGEANSGGAMAVDSGLLLANDPIAGPLIRGHRDFQRGVLKAYPNVHFVSYLGSMRCPTMMDLLRRGDHAAWRRRIEACYAPLVAQSRVHIGLDHAVTYPFDSVMWSACLDLQAKLRAKRRECVLESLPLADRPDQQAFVSLCTEGLWQQQVVTGNLKVAFPRPAYRWLNRGAFHNLKVFGQDVRAWLRSVKADGTRPLCQWEFLKQQGVSYAEFSA